MKDALGNIALRILCLEDDANDRQLIGTFLAQDGLNCKFTQAQSQTVFETALKQKEFDLILSDFSLPGYDGISALGAAKEFQPETPFVLLSGTIGEERVVDILKSGATDCVLKKNLSRLGAVVRRALAEAEERRRRKRAEEALRAQAKQLRALAGRLQASREEERIRISRELHDELGEALMGQKFGLAWIKQQLNQADKPVPREEIIAKLDALSALQDETAQRVRRLCTELRPSILDDLGLPAAIEWQAREFQTRTGMACDLVLKTGSPKVPAQTATAVFRIFQEILTNVARHAKAAKVQVELKAANKQLVLSVNDNGRGIGREKIHGGGSFGLLGMRERAVLLDGNVLIQGVPEKGTSVTVSIPLSTKAAPANPVTGGTRKKPAHD